MSRRTKKRPGWLYALLAGVLGLLVVALLLAGKQQAPVATHDMVISKPVAPSQHRKTGHQLDFAYEELTDEQGLRAPKDVDLIKRNGHPEPGIALVMDDVGYDIEALKRVLALPFPVAIAVLPDAPRATQAANMAHEAGSIVMLHLPMEPTTPKYRASMNDSFLRVDMNKAEVRERFDTALLQVPHAIGVNNHMGSLLTTLASPMQWVMDMCRERSLFFIDSKTSHNSVAAEMAARSGLGWGVRQIFLDHTVDAEDLALAWNTARRCAYQQQSCIVIAHPHAETLNFLEQHVAAETRNQIKPVTLLLHGRAPS